MSILTKHNLALMLAGNKPVSMAHNDLASKWAAALNGAMEKYDIRSVKRISAFIAQLIHESAGFSRLTENLNYSAAGLMATWPNRFESLEKAKKFEKNPQLIANHVYGGRNGNDDKAEGFKYRGRGLIQITFKSNYRDCGQAIGIDLVTYPDLLLNPDISALSAGWFWSSRSLNKLADIGDMVNITKKINGGINGLSDRLEIYDHCLSVLNDSGI